MEEERSIATPRFTFRTTGGRFNRDADQNILLGRVMALARPGYKLMLGVLGLITVTLVVMGVVALVSGVGSVALLCAMGVATLVYMFWRERSEGEVRSGVRQAAKAHEKMTYADTVRIVTVDFREDGCHLRWGQGRGDEKWFDYERFAHLFETEDLFFFSEAREAGFCVRKTDLEGGEVEAFRSWMEEKSGKSVRYYEIKDEKWQSMLKID